MLYPAELRGPRGPGLPGVRPPWKGAPFAPQGPRHDDDDRRFVRRRTDRGLRRGALSPVEVARDVLARIEKNAAFNAFLPIDPAPVLAAAAASEARWRAGTPLGPVDGLPATIKDNIGMKGEPTRRGSRTGDVTAKAARRCAGGGTFARAGRSFRRQDHVARIWLDRRLPLTAHRHHPQSVESGAYAGRFDRRRRGGGAAVRLGVLHLGTDGAAACAFRRPSAGVFGFKPSYGRVPAYPPSPFDALAHQGPIARRVADAALMLSVISGPDARDMTAWNSPAEDFTAGLDDGVRGLRVALSPRLGGAASPTSEIEATARKAARCCRSRAPRSRKPIRRSLRAVIYPGPVVVGGDGDRRCGTGGATAP